MHAPHVVDECACVRVASCCCRATYMASVIYPRPYYYYYHVVIIIGKCIIIIIQYLILLFHVTELIIWIISFSLFLLKNGVTMSIVYWSGCCVVLHNYVQDHFYLQGFRRCVGHTGISMQLRSIMWYPTSNSNPEISIPHSTLAGPPSIWISIYMYICTCNWLRFFSLFDEVCHVIYTIAKSNPDISIPHSTLAGSARLPTC